MSRLFILIYIGDKLKNYKKVWKYLKRKWKNKINNLKIELNFSSLQNLIKSKLDAEEFGNEIVKIYNKFKEVRNNATKSAKEVEKVSDWVITLSKATADIEKVVQKSLPLALNMELNAKCLSCGHDKQGISYKWKI